MPFESEKKCYSANTNPEDSLCRQRDRSLVQLKYYSLMGIYNTKDLSLGISDWSVTVSKCGIITVFFHKSAKSKAELAWESQTSTPKN